MQGLAVVALSVQYHSIEQSGHRQGFNQTKLIADTMRVQTAERETAEWNWLSNDLKI
jgi:hypothetical protein